jgi:peptidoglycan/LPS O-acetylase OafA/YrhL
MRSMQRSGLSGLDLMKTFYIRRFFRIYPLSILTVLGAVALHLHANGRGISFGPRPQPLELTSNLLLVQNLTYSDSIVGPLWSLPIEVQMYVLLPFFFLWRKPPLWGLILLWGVCGILGHWPQTVPALPSRSGQDLRGESQVLDCPRDCRCCPELSTVPRFGWGSRPNE